MTDINIPIEQPPAESNPLKEWLSRMMILINGAFSQVPTQVGVVRELASETSSLQDPPTIDVPLQVHFGAPEDGEYVSIDALGTVTFNREAYYEISIFANVSRTGTPMESYLILYGTLNDVTETGSWVTSISDSLANEPLAGFFDDVFKVGDTIKLYIVRDSSGSDDGFLSSFTPANPAVPPVFSARMVIKRLTLDAVS